jgi:hypothetical protein
MTIFYNSFVLIQSLPQDNVFIISNPKSKYPVLQLDLRYATQYSVNWSVGWKYLFCMETYLLNVYYCRLISDLVVVIVSATCGGIAFACLGQPVSICTFISSNLCIIINSWKHNLSIQNVVFLRLSYVNLQFKVYCRWLQVIYLQDL